ncbi:MAG: hypothetical protein AVO35_10345 [Candidatus Aegiribacteria sp. MLS_C]|nr:MAG: hypothetical protein AVO35_10345 [Candidatus Aegiribacteria sp. MLS_C]
MENSEVPFLPDVPILGDDHDAFIPSKKYTVEIEFISDKSTSERIDQFILYTARAVAESTKVLSKSLEGTDSDRFFLEYMIGRSNAVALTELLKKREQGVLSDEEWAGYPIWVRAIAEGWEKLPIEYKDRLIRQVDEDDIDGLS